MTEIKIESSGRFGTAFHNALIQKEVTLVEFARSIDVNYEHLRKIFRGDMFPSELMLKAISKPLKLNVTDMQVLIAQDRMEKKVGFRAYNAATHRHPRSSEFDAILPHMSEEDIDMVLSNMKTLIRKKKH